MQALHRKIKDTFRTQSKTFDKVWEFTKDNMRKMQEATTRTEFAQLWGDFTKFFQECGDNLSKSFYAYIRDTYMTESNDSFGPSIWAVHHDIERVKCDPFNPKIQLIHSWRTNNPSENWHNVMKNVVLVGQKLLELGLLITALSHTLSHAFQDLRTTTKFDKKVQEDQLSIHVPVNLVRKQVLEEGSMRPRSVSGTLERPGVTAQRMEWLADTLKKRNLEFLPCKPDGLCQFHAMAACLNSLSNTSTYTQETIRETLGNAILDDPNLLQVCQQLLFDTRNRNVDPNGEEDYVNLALARAGDIKKGIVQGEMDTLVVFAHVFKLKIEVLHLTEVLRHTTIIEGLEVSSETRAAHEEKPTVRMIYWPGSNGESGDSGHYDAIIPVASPKVTDFNDPLSKSLNEAKAKKQAENRKRARTRQKNKEKAEEEAADQSFSLATSKQQANPTPKEVPANKPEILEDNATITIQESLNASNDPGGSCAFCASAVKGSWIRCKDCDKIHCLSRRCSALVFSLTPAMRHKKKPWICDACHK